MNNEQFRRLVGANTPKPAADRNGASPGAATPRGVSLGSRQKSIGFHKPDFARQIADQSKDQKQAKKFKSYDPKGSKLAEGYVDRARNRTAEEEDERAARIKALEESLKKGEIDQETFDKLQNQIAGGDLSSTHLIKGLDFKLLERIRQGEDVFGNGDSGAKEESSEEEADFDEELDKLAEAEVTTVAKDKTKKKGQLSTAPLNPSKKRTRDQILADMKAARDAAKAKEDTGLGSKFKKIGAKTPGTRIERDNKGREVLIVVDEDGNEKRKVRKTQSTTEETPKAANMVPDKNAKPLGMEVPEQYRKQVEEPEDEDVNIFDDVGDDYDPLAGLEEEDSEDEETGEKKVQPSEASKEDKASMPPPPRPTTTTEPRNYFKDSKTGLISSEKLSAPSMSDPAIQAAFKKAASLKQIPKSDEDDEEARAKAERLKKLLQSNDRDAEDMDMGFGTSRFEDEEDFEEKRVKLSEWGHEDDDDGHGGGSGSKRKRGPKKRKGDGNNAADVLRDAFAILLAAYHPAIKLLGISTVHGNASLEKTTRNALSVLAAIGKHDEVDVFPGAARGLVRPPVHATDIHGESGLDGTSLLPPPPPHRLAKCTAPDHPSAVEAMAAALRAHPPGTVWISATGALTNVAALFAKYPDLAARIKGLTVMGGSVGDGFTPAVMGVVDGRPRVGNYTEWAEFNVLIDPEAAAAVFDDPVLAAKTTLVPLDLTHLVLATKEVQELLLYGPPTDRGREGQPREGRGRSDLRVMLVELVNFFASTYRDVFGITEGPPLHDPLAVAAILTGTEHEIPFYDYDPKSPEGASRKERFSVQVVTEGTLEDARERGAQTGRTIVKLLPPGSEGVRIPRGLDIKLFWRVIEECCESADQVNKKILSKPAN
ncbi:inosine-uridine preferring nucleoside hydrolase-domain-containing protein [Annulohypoxylon truncatum]|uniref:inosine-uridine preferring nucleoside hydrolase-domain-containing protein n=1 Tax=Annulohypoxylon truncatum TaxID=327061 RepID=UPI002008EB89|nr:inosine-uridine preferring nucleoside hydrolase-domain-containing protein [Annulohypoxylon truncatum]KAI1213963.1 inosine-uridine preferring nucleoside hydrolase-domain-containing protein [Annulohypoxylon truncatum]